MDACISRHRSLHKDDEFDIAICVISQKWKISLSLLLKLSVLKLWMYKFPDT